MHSLRELQTAFAAALDRSGGHIAPLAVDSALESRRMNVYRNNTEITLTEALGSIYPVARRLTGEDFFKYCARAYICAFPSRSGDLNDFGSSFAAFIATFEPARELEYLADVAQFEWIYHIAFHAADHAPLGLERLAAVPEERHEALRFVLHPSARLFQSRYPILKIWKANQDAAGGGETIALDDGGDALLAIRPGLEIEFIRLAPAALEFLRRVNHGDAFGEACNGALRIDPGFQLNEFFAFCVTHGVIVDFTVLETAS